MKLFRQLLVALFPQEIISNSMHPLRMFVSFISPRQFFSVITRKIVENYKLNLFDIGLDPFEVKIWFGDQPALPVKEADNYYAYHAVANLNGWPFYSPANIATALTLIVSIYVKESFAKFPKKYYMSFLTSIYLLTFVFTARIKVFPKWSKEKTYAWFIDVLFNFYDLTLQQYGIESRKQRKVIRTTLLQQCIQVFFMLFTAYQRLNGVFYAASISEKELYQWLFYDELKKWTFKSSAQTFITTAATATREPEFSDIDQDLLQIIFPADVIIRYLFQERDIPLVVETLVAPLYDKERLDGYVFSFLQGDEKFEEYIQYICDYRIYKAHFFHGLQQLTAHKFRLKQDYETSKEIDTFMSTIGESESLDNVKMPDILKKESLLVEKLMNFYVTFLGGMRVGRGDNFAMRLFRKPLIDELLWDQELQMIKQDALYYYGALLYHYSKNVFYYKYAFENVKAGREKFYLPSKSTFKEVYSNMFILKLFDENFINTILQDINTKTMRVHVSNPAILNMFKNILWREISRTMKLSNKALLTQVYTPVAQQLTSMPHFLPTVCKRLTDNDCVHLKENLYTIDLRLWRETIGLLEEHEVHLSDTYGDMSILWILAGLRETLFGYLLYYTHLLAQEATAGISYKLHALKKIYILDVLNISEHHFTPISAIIEQMVIRYHPLLTQWISLDDNKGFFNVWANNRMRYSEQYTEDKLALESAGEDIVWLRGYLKAISYYNKRYLLPK